MCSQQLCSHSEASLPRFEKLAATIDAMPKNGIVMSRAISQAWLSTLNPNPAADSSSKSFMDTLTTTTLSHMQIPGTVRVFSLPCSDCFPSTIHRRSVIICDRGKAILRVFRKEAKLVNYLTILRDNQQRTDKKNCTAQGFYCDGLHHRFLCITAEGAIKLSSMFAVLNMDLLKVIFSFIVSMMKIAMKTSPHTAPTTPGAQRDKKRETSRARIGTRCTCRRGHFGFRQ